MTVFTKNTIRELNKLMEKSKLKVKVKMGKELSFIPYDDIILFRRKYDDMVDEMFINHLKEMGIKKLYSVYTLSFLHELGHYMTYEFFTNEEWVDMVLESLELSDKYDNLKDLNTAYWNLPHENQANLFIIELVNSGRCKGFLKKLDKIFLSTKKC